MSLLTLQLLFFWLLRGAKVLSPIPFVKMTLSAGALGATVGTAMGEYSMASREAGGVTVGTGPIGIHQRSKNMNLVHLVVRGLSKADNRYHVVRICDMSLQLSLTTSTRLPRYLSSMSICSWSSYSIT